MQVEASIGGEKTVKGELESERCRSFDSELLQNRIKIEMLGLLFCGIIDLV